MPALGLGLGIHTISPYIIPGAGGGNIVGSTLVLYNANDGLWYATGVYLIGGDPVFGAPTATAAPPPGTPQTVTLPCPQDGTTHVVRISNDDGGAAVLWAEQANAGGSGEALVIDAYDLIIFKDDGGVYVPTPS